MGCQPRPVLCSAPLPCANSARARSCPKRRRACWSDHALATRGLGQAGAALAVFARWRQGGRQPRQAGNIVGGADDYGSAGFWDRRYATHEPEDGTHDWLGPYSRFREPICTATGGNRTARVLDLGCGTSGLLEDLWDDGYRHLVGVDLSAAAVEIMHRRNSEVRPGIQWLACDVGRLRFESCCFDLVVDKGTMDAVMCNEDGDPLQIVRMISEVSRVLRVGGTYLVLSCSANPRQALSCRPEFMFEVSEREVPVSRGHLFLFCARKVR